MFKGIAKKKVMVNDVIVSIEYADLECLNHRKAIRTLLSEYMADPMGGKLPCHTLAKHKRMIDGLSCVPTAIIFLAFYKTKPVGMAICFSGFSTFNAAPLINIHDIIVSKQFRGNGIGRRLLMEIQELAISTGCCKITLEVRKDNATARALYRKTGFTKGTMPMEFLTKLM